MDYTPAKKYTTYTNLSYKHPVLTLYGYGKILTEGISLIFWREIPLKLRTLKVPTLKLRVLKDILEA